MTALVEVRRLLHVNYNCVDIDVLERWYTELFALKTVMRTETDAGDATAFGLQLLTASSTIFLYDHRGARRTSSLELVHWTSPPTFGRAYPNPWDHGIQSVAYSAPDLDEVERKIGQLGGRVLRRRDDVLLAKDPEDVTVEIYSTGSLEPEQLHLRLSVHDLAKSADWWAKLGFQPAERTPAVPAAELWPDEPDHTVDNEIALVGTDDPTLSIVLTSWDGPPPIGPSYGAPFHQGLYRMAMAVDDVHAAYAALMVLGIPRQPTYTFAMPGTKLTHGLTILFIRDPDGILVELVDRPRQPG
jgi:catechol 2,3-dioxygenase-like lactoylglutathione lyase family enzyme